MSVSGGVQPVGVEACLWSDVLRLALAAGGGRLQHAEILAAAARGALFVDLVDHGIVTLDNGDMQFAEKPDVVVPLATQLVAELQQHPSRTLSDHLQRGRPHLGAFIRTLLDAGVWEQRGAHLTKAAAHYDDSASPMTADLRGALRRVASGAQPAHDSRQAALAAFAAVLHLYPGHGNVLIPPPDCVWPACDHLDWIVRDVTTYLYDAQVTDLAAGSIDGATNAWQLGAS